ncbi:MAG: DUF2752 domain-containing protein [Acidimicrobiales bacterium]|nr:DUF2752 domain-containing protein [Acidimicrobiales bacterium]
MVRQMVHQIVRREVGRDVRQPVVVGAVAAAGVAVLALVDADRNEVPLCPLKAITGLDCPLCGGLRAVSALTRMNVAEAMDHNALFTLSVPLLVAAWLAWLWASIRPEPRWQPPTWAVPALLTVLVAFAVARNLPYYPWLASEA